MKVDNPKSNKYPSEVTDELVLNAVERSGYPLQIVVADELRARKFDVSQEWAFLDTDSNQLRTVDLLAEKRLYEDPADLRVRPSLAMVAECKQSELPYVFFLAGAPFQSSDFPMFAGLQRYEIEAVSNDTRDKYCFPLSESLELGSGPFSRDVADCCSTFSKCARHGKRLEIRAAEDEARIELSGSSAYHNLVLPLVKSMHHFRRSQRPPDTAVYFDLSIVLGVAVLDAPMLGIELEAGKPKARFTPWVRVGRYEYQDANHRHERQRLMLIDVIHKDLFGRYVDEHVMPFSKQFASRAVKHCVELASGEAFVPGLAKSLVGLEKRMLPRPPKVKAAPRQSQKLSPWT